MHRIRQALSVAIVFAGVMLLSRAVADAGPPANADASAQAFKQMTQVLRHPRCMNCHSKGDFPRQGDDMHQHTMNVRRGPAGLGVTAQKCSTCHQDHNLEQAHLPPGAPSWHLPSPKMPMIWEGLSDAQLCASLKDPNQNNHRNLREIQEHLTADKLVDWGWHPGVGREPVPVAKPQFNALVKQWVDGGGACPQ